MFKTACFFFFVTAQAAFSACSENVVWLRGDFGQARFSVEIADDPTERAQGLMHRPSLPLSSGMLFVYDRPGPLSFWMKDTLIELDLLFIDPKGTVRYVHHRAQPMDETSISGGDGLTHVLEINGGLAEQLGLKAGAQIRHPSFSQDLSVWPC